MKETELEAGTSPRTLGIFQGGGCNGSETGGEWAGTKNIKELDLAQLMLDKMTGRCLQIFERLSLDVLMASWQKRDHSVEWSFISRQNF